MSKEKLDNILLQIAGKLNELDKLKDETWKSEDLIRKNLNRHKHINRIVEYSLDSIPIEADLVKLGQLYIKELSTENYDKN